MNAKDFYEYINSLKPLDIYYPPSYHDTEDPDIFLIKGYDFYIVYRGVAYKYSLSNEETDPDAPSKVKYYYVPWNFYDVIEDLRTGIDIKDDKNYFILQATSSGDSPPMDWRCS